VLPQLLDRFARGDRLALSRLLSLAGGGEHAAAIRAALPAIASSRRSRVIALTGAGGVGKSTLMGKLIEQFRNRGLTVAVLACDPQSPLTGGALLGDRVRMPTPAEDLGVFIRSLAAPGGQHALAGNLDLRIALLEAFAFHIVLLETVGAGQGDTDVRHLADTVVVLVQAEAGDEIQWEKAGLLEVADVVVVHKGDLPGAERVEAQVRGMLALSAARQPPILRVSAIKNQGVAELAAVLLEMPLRRGIEVRSEEALLTLAHRRLNERVQAEPGRLAELAAAWREGRLTGEEAAERLLQGGVLDTRPHAAGEA